MSAISASSVEILWTISSNFTARNLRIEMVQPEPYKYRAFLSYSHRDDRCAKRLHKDLETFRIGKDLVGRETPTGQIPRSLRPIFRDREEFSAGQSLTSQTRVALESSPFLIVLCSPDAARSRYVNEEIRLFKAMGRTDAIIPIIVDGEPGNPERDPFPPALRFEVDFDGNITEQLAEVLAADERESGDGRHLAVAKVAARLLGCRTDEVFRRADRERRRGVRIRNGIIVALALLAVTAIGSAIWAYDQLKTNEAFLDATLERFSSVVYKAVSLSKSYAMPLEVTLGFLEEAEGMVDVIAEYGRPTPKLTYRKAIMVRAFADHYRDLGQIADWERRTLEARQLMLELVKQDPDNADWSLELGLAHEGYGDVLFVNRKLTVALAEYRARHEIIKRLAAGDPQNARWQRDLSVSHNKFGDVLVAQGEPGGALRNYRVALAIRERLAAGEPQNTGWQRDLSVSLERIGDVLVSQGNLNGALRSYRTALAIRERLAAGEPQNTGWQHDLSVSHNKVGDVLVAKVNPGEALKSYWQSHAVLERLAAGDPQNAGWKRDLAWSHWRLAQQGDRPHLHWQRVVDILKKLESEGRLSPTDQKWLPIALKNLAELK